MVKGDRVRYEYEDVHGAPYVVDGTVRKVEDSGRVFVAFDDWSAFDVDPEKLERLS